MFRICLGNIPSLIVIDSLGSICLDHKIIQELLVFVLVSVLGAEFHSVVPLCLLFICCKRYFNFAHTLLKAR